MVLRAAGLTFDAALGALADTIQATLAAVRRRPLLAFLVTACAFSWSDWLTLALSGGRIVPGRLPTDMAGMAGPAFAAFAVAAIGGGEAGIRDLGRRLLRLPFRSPWFWLLAPSPLWVGLAALGARAALGLRVPPLASFALYPGLPVMPLVTEFDLVLLGVGFGQEIGWRGFALPRLQRRFGPLGGALLVSVAWGAWLLPLAFLHRPPQGGEELLALERLALTALLVPAASVVLAFVLARTRGSIPAVALWHGSLRMVTASTGAKGAVEEVVFWTVLLGAAAIVALELGRRGTGRTLLEPRPDAP